MVRTRRSRRADQTKLIAGIVLITLLVGAVVGLIVVRAKVQAARVDLDPITQCPVVGPRSVTVVVVDRTDPISDVTALALRNELTAVVEKTPQYGALYLYSIDGEIDGVAKPLFFRCNPGDASTVNELTGSKAKAQRRFDQQFSEPLDSALMSLAKAETAPSSPIMEGLQGAALSAFSHPHAKEASPKRLIIVSDFMQNSDRVSFYGGSAARQLTSPEGLDAPLHGVTVGLLFIQRPLRGGPSIEELKVAWRAYFIESGVAPPDVRTVKLTGSNP